LRLGSKGKKLVSGEWDVADDPFILRSRLGSL
jgi:hypothetical protein